MQDCLFCKIIAGEIPSYKVYEDDKVLAFLDINPVNPGHTLLAPKEHSENTLKVPDALLEHIIVVLKKITPGILKAVGAEACNVGMNTGSIAGQVVMHTHWHIMPRFGNDGHKLFNGRPYKEGGAEKITEKVRDNIE